jgi:hypothetical protein
MQLFTEQQIEQLHRNDLPENQTRDHEPVAKIVIPDMGIAYLFTRLDDTGTAYGLCDVGLGAPELGYIDLHKLQAITDRYSLSVEQDRHFRPKYPLSVYARAAMKAGAITDSLGLLMNAVPVS